MAKKITKLRPWKAPARGKVKTSVIAHKLKRSVGAHQEASKHGVTLGTSQRSCR